VPDKLEWLHDHGPGPKAFTFKQAYGPDGEPYSIDRQRVKALVAANAPGQADLLAQVNAMPVSSRPRGRFNCQVSHSGQKCSYDDFGRSASIM
jgi:hypothetical protein